MPTAKEIQQWLIEQVANLSKTPVNKIDSKKTFIDYGLESIELVGISGDLESWLHCRLEPDLLYRYPTIDALAQYLENLCATQGTISEKAEATLRKTDTTQKFFPLSYRQEWLFLNSHLGLNILFAIQVKDELDMSSLTRAINEIIKRHDNLRTSLTMHDQKPMQFITPHHEVEIPLIKLKHDTNNSINAAKEIALKMIQEEIDLSKPPLMRISILETDNNEYFILFLFHHLIFDGFSVWVFLHELKILYTHYKNKIANLLEPLPFQYIDYVNWQRETLVGETLHQHLNYWRKKLANIPSVFHDKPSLLGKLLTYHFTFAEVDEQRLTHFASEHHVTPFLILLTAFSLLLSYYAKQNEMIISIVDADRFPPITKTIIGYFSNHIYLRIKLNSEQSFLDLLQQIKQEYLETFEHHIVPFGKMISTADDETLKAKDAELVGLHGKILFNFIKIPDEMLPPLTAQSSFLHSRNLPVESWESEEYDPRSSPENFRHIFIRIMSERSELFGSLTYAERLFHKEEAQAFVKEYQRCINAAIHDPKLTINALIAKVIENDAH